MIAGPVVDGLLRYGKLCFFGSRSPLFTLSLIMPIKITCPGCHKRFTVADKFAGQKGPCPNCKNQIAIPNLDDEVKVHEPDAFGGGRDSAGKLVLEPIKRADVKLPPMVILGIVGGIVVTLFAGLVLRMTFNGEVPYLVLGVGALLLAPPVAFGGYTFLREFELEPYRGMAVFFRSACCSVVFAALWFIYWYICSSLQIEGSPEIWQLTFILPVMFVVGGIASWASYEIDFTMATIHYGFYFGVCVLMRLIMGMSAV